MKTGIFWTPDEFGCVCTRNAPGPTEAVMIRGRGEGEGEGEGGRVGVWVVSTIRVPDHYSFSWVYGIPRRFSDLVRGL